MSVALLFSLLFLTENPSEEFLEFSSVISEVYTAKFQNGSYNHVVVRGTEMEIHRCRFRADGYVNEIYLVPNAISPDAARQLANTVGQSNDSMANLTLVTVMASNNDYSFSLKINGGRKDDSVISSIVVHADDTARASNYPSIFQAITLARHGRIDDAVRSGHLTVTYWQFDEQAKLWTLKLDVPHESEHYELKYDPNNKTLRQIISHDRQRGAYNYKLELVYDDDLPITLRVFSPTLGTISKDPVFQLLETHYFGAFASDNVDSELFRISHYGHQEPIIGKPKTSIIYQILSLYWLPILGAILLLIAIRLKKKVE
ncbi:MAG: hypothetical protein JNK57_20420 [Planctomycetaceae bacterium]|nr:hypothetical protein [Planctomycetaceae bacterium]